MSWRLVPEQLEPQVEGAIREVLHLDHLLRRPFSAKRLWDAILLACPQNTGAWQAEPISILYLPGSMVLRGIGDSPVPQHFESGQVVYVVPTPREGR